MELEQKICNIIADNLALNHCEVETSDELNDLDADSIDRMEIFMMLEEEFDIAIPDDVADGWQTVQNIVDYVVEKIHAGESNEH